MKEMFSGSCVALITPFKKGKIDYKKLEEMIEIQICAGTKAILILGTTGESPTVTEKERAKMMSFCRKKIGRRCLMLVGAGSNSTAKTVELCRIAEDHMADGVLVVTPYYNKCTQEGLFLHYKTVAESINIPLIMYNVPSRTGVNIEPETAEKLSKVKNIVGIKEANSNKEHIENMIKKLVGKIAIYSGSDELNFFFLEHGARGVISVTANLFPELIAMECKEYFSGYINNAKSIHDSLEGMNRALFLETNPIPVKYGASYMNLCENELRLPLTELTRKNAIIVEQEIDKLK